MSCPPNKMRPEVGYSNPASMRNRVDLPQPELPSRAKISPLRMDSDTSLTAATSPKRLTRRSVVRNPSSGIAFVTTSTPPATCSEPFGSRFRQIPRKKPCPPSVWQPHSNQVRILSGPFFEKARKNQCSARLAKKRQTPVTVKKTGLVRTIACTSPSIFMNLLVPENKNGFIYPS